MQKIISIKNGVTRMPEWRMAEPVNFEACDGEHIAIVGPNGGGKSMFVDIIVGRHPLLMHDPDYDFSPSQKTMVSDNIKYITFRDTYGGDNDRTYFLQQRWNQLEIDENTPIVKDKLEEAYQMAGEDTPERRALQQHIYELFHMQHLMDKYTILLSSGELRKFKLASTLFSEPRVLIMDNPFIGLDAETRDQLKELLKTLSSERALQIILVLSKSDDIPDFITHVVEVKDMKVLPKVTLAEYLAGRESVPAHVLSPELEQAIVDQPYSDREYHTQEVVKMNKVSIPTPGSAPDRTEPERVRSSVWSVPTIRRVTPATLPSSTILEAAARASGTSRNTSATYRLSFTALTSATCQPSAS